MHFMFFKVYLDTFDFDIEAGKYMADWLFW